jgi:hypothetical protein
VSWTGGLILVCQNALRTGVMLRATVIIFSSSPQLPSALSHPQARFDDLANFSGHSSEDVDRCLKSLKNITKATDESDSYEIFEIVRGKLTKSAGIWFDKNESNFRKCLDLETAFRNRYFSTTMIYKKFDKLKQRKQAYDGTIISYFVDVVNIC